MKYPKYIGSSVNPEQLALSVKGVLVGLVPLVLFLAGFYKINLGQEDLTNFINGVSDLIIAVGGVASVAMVLWGVVRKILVALGIIKVN